VRYALDANICILLLTGHSAVVSRVAQCEEGDLALSAIAFGEVAIGIARGKPPPGGALEALVARVATLVPFDEAAARCYAALPFKRGSFDRLIAAHALALDLTLVTNNERDFADIPGLRVENWTQ
jgi:tRNA(fMet)-specific endonuclease VapC